MAAATPNPPTQLQRRLPAAQQAELITDYLSGTGAKELARKYKIHRSTVTALLVRAGVPLHQHGLCPEQIVEAAKLYRQGWSLARLSERFHVSDMTVRAHLLRAGVMMRKPWDRP